MSALPRGTVTFLFTDIEGSTALWEHHAQAMADALARHDALLQHAIERHGGAVFKTVGDAFCAAFATAPQALHAALAAQRALQTEVWRTSRPLWVRIALHTGSTEARNGDYFGPALNRVARLLVVGHGGQILLSAVTQQLVRDSLPLGVTLRDLGEHHLKDLIDPERVYQVVVPDLPADFPPLHTLRRRRTNLPQRAISLIGREREVAAVCTLLRRNDLQLLTLSGPGGIGKTRLALEIAAELLEDFADGVFVVALASISDPDLVVSTIAQTLGVKDVSSLPLPERLHEELRDKQVLLLLDNFEQVVEAAPLLAALLEVCLRLKVLVTSRTVLRLYGEQEFEVPPLTLPDRRHLPPVEQLSQYEAVRLFLERARAVKADFTLSEANASVVVEICHRLDGLPLALELAAARVKLLSPSALLARLDKQLQLLTGGARNLPKRQQTLRGTIDWSYNLLTAAEQTLFRRLGVFVGGCTIEAAEAVCKIDDDVPLDVLDGLQSLLDKSLLDHVEGVDGARRFRMLETIWEYAREQLRVCGEAEALQQQHADYYFTLAEAAEPELLGLHQGVWLTQLEAEHDNLRAALSWFHKQGAVERGLRLAGTLWRFWEMHGYFAEGRKWIQVMLSMLSTGDQYADTHVPAAVQARAFAGAGVLASNQGDYAQAIILYEESLRLWRELEDKDGMAQVLNSVGNVAQKQGDYARAVGCLEKSLVLRQELGDKVGIARSLTNLGLTVLYQGEYARAAALLQESLALWHELEDTWSIARTLNNLGLTVLYQGEYARAAALLQESLALFQKLSAPSGVANALSNLGNVALSQNDDVQARIFYNEGLVTFQELGDRGGIAECLEGLARVASAQRDLVRAVQLLGAAAALRNASGVPLRSIERSIVDSTVDAMRTSLSEDQFTAAWAAGQVMTPERAIAYALESVPPVGQSYLTRSVGK